MEQEKQCIYRNSKYSVVPLALRGEGPVGRNFYYPEINLVSKEGEQRQVLYVREGDKLQEHTGKWYDILLIYCGPNQHAMFKCQQDFKQPIVNISIDSVIAFGWVKDRKITEHSNNAFSEVMEEFKRNQHVGVSKKGRRAEVHMCGEGLTKNDRDLWATMSTHISNIDPALAKMSKRVKKLKKKLTKQEEEFQKMSQKMEQMNKDHAKDLIKVSNRFKEHHSHDHKSKKKSHSK